MPADQVRQVNTFVCEVQMMAVLAFSNRLYRPPDLGDPLPIASS
ncbi:hypothetical protein POG22_04845 [Geitlerinema sp. CS-897]|nr:hypothetical protein [Baaleninema simplex]MDC0832338.1 hypothetical protein [Geitlerinema sp. CS-897]